MSENRCSNEQWRQSLSYLEIDAGLVNEIIESVKTFAGSYNQALETLNHLANTPVTLEERSALIPHWDTAIRESSGDCVDLAFDLLNLWKRDGVDSELHDAGVEVYYCEGTEPQFFNSNIDNHAFIAFAADSSDDASLVIDPALQRICQFMDSGYVIRSKNQKPHLDRPSGREIRFTELPANNWKVPDFLTSDIAVLGLTSDRAFAISLGFAKWNDFVYPFLAAGRGESRGVMYYSVGRDELIKRLSDLGEISKSEHVELKALGETLANFRFLPAQE